MLLSNLYACHAVHYSLFLQPNQSPDFFVLTRSRLLQSLSLKNWTKYTWYFIYLLRLLSKHIDLSNIILVWCSLWSYLCNCNLTFELYRCPLLMRLWLSHSVLNRLTKMIWFQTCWYSHLELICITIRWLQMGKCFCRWPSDSFAYFWESHMIYNNCVIDLFLHFYLFS